MINRKRERSLKRSFPFSVPARSFTVLPDHISGSPGFRALLNGNIFYVSTMLIPKKNGMNTGGVLNTVKVNHVVNFQNVLSSSLKPPIRGNSALSA